MNKLLSMNGFEYNKWLKAHTKPSEVILTPQEKRWVKEVEKRRYYYDICLHIEIQNRKIKTLKKNYNISEETAQKINRHYKALVKIMEQEGGFKYPELQNPIVKEKVQKETKRRGK